MRWCYNGLPTGTHICQCLYVSFWTQFKPVVDRSDVADTFLLCSENVEKFKTYLNKKHKYIVFTCEIEQNGSFSFLDIKISRENKFFTLGYRKPTFSGVWTNFESFISKCYKRSFIDSLLYKGFSLLSNMGHFHLEISSLNSVFRSNGYPRNFIDFCMEHFLDKSFVKRKESLTVPKVQLVRVLPYPGKSTLDLRARLRCTIE